MAVLKITNFLKIKSAEIDILPIVLLIGPQASGKSIIAKLTYFLKEFTSSEMMRALQEETTFTHFENEAKNKFKNIFPPYTWGKTEFTIEYIDSDNYVKIINKKTSTRYKFDIKFSDSLKFIYNDISTQYRANLLSQKSIKKENFRPKNRYQIFFEIVDEITKKNKQLALNENSIFIPAGRSYFTNVKAFVFSFLSETIDIDPLLKDFGRYLENIKGRYDSRTDIIPKKYLKPIDNIVSEVLCGKYINSNDEDWIVSNKKRVKVINSSSGQQESLPMLLVLSYYPFLYTRLRHSTFFIEEPEAHLFPLSQKKIIDLIGFAYNHTGRRNQFFITTHSPYVVAAINNLILASQVTLKKDISEEIKVLHESSIKFDDVSAYSVDNGTVKPIKDMENLIIDADYIDNVSNMFERDYNALLDVIYGSKKD